jgi:hypothetical protein
MPLWERRSNEKERPDRALAFSSQMALMAVSVRSKRTGHYKLGISSAGNPPG